MEMVASRSDPIEDDCVTNRVFGVFGGPAQVGLGRTMVGLWVWVSFPKASVG